MTITIANKFGPDVSSRSSAAELRSLIIGNAAPGAPVTLDFAGVRTVSDSFADELIAVLVEARGEDWFRAHVKVVNLHPVVRRTILESVHFRLHGTLA